MAHAPRPLIRTRNCLASHDLATLGGVSAAAELARAGTTIPEYAEPDGSPSLPHSPAAGGCIYEGRADDHQCPGVSDRGPRQRIDRNCKSPVGYPRWPG